MSEAPLLNIADQQHYIGGGLSGRHLEIPLMSSIRRQRKSSPPRHEVVRRTLILR